ncbi:MAG: hypothetical protein J6S29_02220 [Methanosphaera sp.]|nr:hypothetical protein [Methanosphaera sp.]
MCVKSGGICWIYTCITFHVKIATF